MHPDKVNGAYALLVRELSLKEFGVLIERLIEILPQKIHERDFFPSIKHYDSEKVKKAYDLISDNFAGPEIRELIELMGCESGGDKVVKRSILGYELIIRGAERDKYRKALEFYLDSERRGSLVEYLKNDFTINATQAERLRNKMFYSGHLVISGTRPRDLEVTPNGKEFYEFLCKEIY